MTNQKHDKHIAILLLTGALSALVAFGAGYLVSQNAQNSNATDVPHDSQNAEDKQADTSHKHTEPLTVSADEAPRVSLTVAKDALSGWNVTLHTKKFRFAPENASGKHVLGEGHAHLYVNGKKIARLYGSSFHYNEDFEGSKTFRVTLNANDHREYAADGQVVAAQQKVSADHSHSHHNHSH